MSAEPGHNSGAASGKHILAYLERVEAMHAQRKEIGDDIADVWAEARGNGYDVPALKELVKLRALDPDKRRSKGEMVDLYANAIGMVL